MENTGKKNIAKNVYSIFFLLLLIMIFSVPAYSILTLQGNVIDENGKPIKDAKVTLYRNNIETISVYTDENGQFTLYSDGSLALRLYITKEDPTTSGIDYFPVTKYLYDYDDESFIIVLKPAITLYIIGDTYIVQSNNLDSKINYHLYDPDTNLSVSYQMIDSNQFIIPFNQSLNLEVDYSSYSPSSGHIELSLMISEVIPTDTQRGENVTVDVTPYFLSHNHNVLKSAIDDVSNLILEMEEYGFYLSNEKNRIQRAELCFHESISYLSEEKYSLSFGSCKKGYAETVQTHEILVNMYNEARNSIGPIISFMAIASIVFSFSLAEKNIYKIGGGVIIFSVFLVILYLIYPACSLFSYTQYIKEAALPLLVSLVSVLILPRFLRGKERPDGNVPFKNTILPLYYLTKRNIRRRKGRFLLTIISITLFIAGFVSLTSFTESYGLLKVQISGEGSQQPVLLVRPPYFDGFTPIYHSSSLNAIEWFNQQEEVDSFISKVDSFPFACYLDIYYNEGIGFEDIDRSRMEKTLVLFDLPPSRHFEVHGIIGIEPEMEDQLVGISNIIKEGTLPSESGVTISDSLANYWAVNLGQNITIRGLNFTVEGIFSSGKLGNIKDVDGSYYLPGCDNSKVFFGPPICAPDRVLIFHVSSAQKIGGVKYSRYALLIDNSYDIAAFAERVAIEGGYWAYTSTASTGLTLYKFDQYDEMKGMQILVPWFIIVLNVIVTIMNSLYERKKEIHTLSSIGVNPTQIAVIFLLEASIVGFMSGSMGYLTGMSMYKALDILGINIGVHQKISSSWSLASIGLAATSALAGAIIAIRNSLVITPSQWRRWQFKKEADGFMEPSEIDIPVRVERREAEAFANFMLKSLYYMDSYESEKDRKVEIQDNRIVIKFSYTNVQQTLRQRTYSTFNTLIVDLSEDPVRVSLESKGEWDSMRLTGNLVRTMAMRWGVTDERSKILGKND